MAEPAITSRDPATITRETATDARTALTASASTFGVGARVTAAVMADDYADIIVGALADLDTGGLTIDTGDVSTFVGGDETDLLRYITDLGEALSRTGHHASLTVQLSRGCPGEVVCDLPGGAGPRGVDVPQHRTTGRYAAAEWALYPLADQVHRPGDAEPDHMRDIYAAIERARELGTFRTSEHFVTRLEGDLGNVIATAFTGWILAGATVQHVVSHLTISLNSPSHHGAEPSGGEER